ncbi:hypothetical protein NEUTE1DRAFT_105955 [Neurospora tetrasperma FGSC 2508]|uniref:Major facilitator superfamily (MFS) profile domain-containing protein n=1 Tax=Neurospora tetrasperma (strain FGSC 2508 / ATCC MYA-4615 / P0657) TaxID=510951 RepID=F8N0S0_NEUT8|nr:uncharacterized protein NEUTE1DRAFT_105955 [Neurospora tetrasperma FGSC 2508]EGO53006.1 hypothetical protein NEUTE1DRAFT_105955 [Neurospora tetrasperma FGSC 2508]
MTLPSYRHDSNENNDVHSLSDITEEIHRTDRTVSNKSKQQHQQIQEEHSETVQHGSRSPVRRILLTFTICAGLMFSCLDTSIVSTALVSISLDLGDAQDAPWTILGYLLTYMSFAVGFSKVSDIYGRRNLLAIAWVFFAGFSVWCALAGSMKQLIAARALQGIGGSGLYSLAQCPLRRARPHRYLLTLAGRPSTAIRRMDGYPQNRLCCYHLVFGDSWAELDSFGGLGNLSVLRAESSHPADIPRAAGDRPRLSVNDHVCLGPRPASDSSRQHYRRTQLALTRICRVTFLTGLVYISLVIKIPERFQVIYGDSALRAGIHLLPMLGSCAFGSTLAGSISKKRNLTSHTLTSGNSLQVIGLGLVYRFSNTTERGDIRYILGFTAIYGLGVGLCFAACTMIAAIEARHGDLAAAQGAVAQVRVLGGSLGLSICTIIFNDILQTSLGPATEAGRFPATVLDQLHRSPLAVFMLPPEQQILVKKVYSDAFRYQMLLMMAVVAVAVLASLGTYRSKPPAVVDSMIHHKVLAARPSDTELESASSVRSLVRGVS